MIQVEGKKREGRREDKGIEIMLYSSLAINEYCLLAGRGKVVRRDERNKKG